MSPHDLGPLFDEIEKLAGYLKGNEMFWARLEDQPRDIAPDTQSPVYQPADFTVPGPHGFTFEHGFWNDPTDWGYRSTGQLLTELERQAKVEWQSGVDSVTDCGSAMLSMCQTVWDPDTAPLRQASLATADVAYWIFQHVDDTVPSFVTNLKKSWPASSLGSKSFYTFFDKLADTSAQYALAAVPLAQTAAATTRIIEEYQKNLTKIVSTTVNHLNTALTQWQKFKAPFKVTTTETTDDSPLNDVLGGISLATGIIAAFPSPLTPFATGASIVTGILSYVFQDPKTIKTKITSVATADEILDNFYDAVNRLPQEMSKALDHLDTSGVVAFNQLVKESATNPNWKPPTVHL